MRVVEGPYLPFGNALLSFDMHVKKKFLSLSERRTESPAE